MLPPKLIVFCGALLAAVPARADTIVASWYGPGFNGRPTASGCLYNQWAMTAASRVFPMGTVLAVTHNGLTVEVVVNDRGPYIKGRDLDLSLGAASALGMVRAGVARVQVQVVGIRPPTCRMRLARSAVVRTD